jgi:Ser-tRNA(Ala) deacylase AlaX
MVLMVDLQAGYEVVTKSKADPADLAKAFIPANFNPQSGKPLRLVTIGDYRPVPCGGTHVGSIRGIRSVTPIKVYAKGGKIRVTYTCTVHETWAS